MVEVSIVDINGDGLKDIYINASIWETQICVEIANIYQSGIDKQNSAF